MVYTPTWFLSVSHFTSLSLRFGVSDFVCLSFHETHTLTLSLAHSLTHSLSRSLTLTHSLTLSLDPLRFRDHFACLMDIRKQLLIVTVEIHLLSLGATLSHFQFLLSDRRLHLRELLRCPFCPALVVS